MTQCMRTWHEIINVDSQKFRLTLAINFELLLT